MPNIESLFVRNFNPRSLAGATTERLIFACGKSAFQSTLPRGSDGDIMSLFGIGAISIHAPSRERPNSLLQQSSPARFQSTLPRGSDLAAI